MGGCASVTPLTPPVHGSFHLCLFVTCLVCVGDLYVAYLVTVNLKWK
jgi:hypothetical protein